MSNRTQYEIVVDTDTYSGDFEREMATFVFGAVSEYGCADLLEKIDSADLALMKWAWDSDTGEGALELQQDEDYGASEFQRIEPTPNWANNGMAKQAQLKDELTGTAPAYQSVAFRFNRELTPEELALVVERGKLFPAFYKAYEPHIQPNHAAGISIIDVRLVERLITVNEDSKSLL